MKKQFDLQYYLEHPETKVVTREGRSVRIICTDAMSEDTNKVVGLIRFNDYESGLMFNPDGLVFNNSEHSDDLFFDLPEPVKNRVPLTYEDLLERVKAGKTMWVTFNNISFEQIISFSDDSVVTPNRDSSYSWLKQVGCFGDGDPCWKEVEE